MRPNHTDGGRVSKTVTLSRAAATIVWRTARGTGLTHSAVIEYLIRRYGEQLLEHDKELLRSAK
jgi:hypothetical protein